jgi:hypothetical protein
MGTPNTIYDLSSVLFHALEGGATYDRYIRDAEGTGERELAEFFRRVRDEDSMRADEAQRLLAERTPPTGGTEGDFAPTAEGIPPRTEPIDAPPREADVPPRRTEGAPPRPEPSGDLPGTEPIREETPPTRTEEVPPPEEVPSGIPPQAPPGDVQRATSPEPPPPGGKEDPLDASRAESVPPGEAHPTGTGKPSRTEERSTHEDREEDKGPLDKARDYLLGEGRERDYLRGE